MHVGKSYPYHCDLFAVTAQFWPGWMPRGVRVDFGFNGLSPWTVVDGQNFLSFESRQFIDRESIQYHMALPVGVDHFNCEIGTRTDIIPGKKVSHVLLSLNIVGFGTINAEGFKEAPCRSFGFLELYSTNGLMGPVLPYRISCDVRAATWAEQSPPTDNHGLHSWICSNVLGP